MTQEEKQLLLKDICARLPYDVKVLADIDKTFDSGCIGIINKIEQYVGDKFPDLKGQYLLYEKGCLTPLVIDEVRPYLRPMSSMTEEERSELRIIWHEDFAGDSSLSPENLGIAAIYPCYPKTIDFYISHHLDYRGLIEKGLALEAPKDMYKTE